MKSSYQILSDAKVDFKNNVTFCVGTGRMGLALTQEYMDQLRLIQQDIGFKYIRGHGLFADDMAIYQEYTDENNIKHAEYNFTYLDLVMDNYKSVGLKPFLELGFMPSKLASGDQTIFYWNGNVTPPSSYDAWCDLVTSTLKHLCDRYGKEEVVTWPIEVWNEPNLPGFWKDANMEEYFVLFEKTFRAIKELDPAFKIGGPAICGVEDKKHMTDFMNFISSKHLKIDFITRHHYTSDFPEMLGHYSYINLIELNESFSTLEDSRSIIDSYEDYRGLPMHITEFNTSYVPDAPIHDTNRNAAYVASMLAKFPETSESYSYWTFGDIFEERGVPFTPFYGGFGLLANHSIKKPTYHTFKFFSDLKGQCILKEKDCIVFKGEDGTVRGLAYNSSLHRTGDTLDLTLSIAATDSPYTLITKTVDETTCNPLKVWHDLGEPTSLSDSQIALLKQSDSPQIATAVLTPSDGLLNLSLTLKEYGLIYFELSKRTFTPDRGYDYNRVEEL